ncbi:DUF262 domain-containing protein [Methylobacterium komagatae]|uniref:DUF262 domain-containing protein n=1 Tax=Methylobacterium komagatae TaxID=374425 RepID=A0ABW2BNX3_9HYPH
MMPDPTDADEIPSDQPVEIEDEYKLALETAGVEDETLLEQPGDVRFVITSYGADYPIDTVISRLKSGAFFIPPFQRRFVWSQRHASRFIESLLMGLPVPGIFLYREAETNRHLVVDGQQRLRSLQYFYEGVFLEKKFRLTGVADQWNNLSYDQLSPADKLRLGDSIIHSTIFHQDAPKQAHRSLYFVFERINSGGIRLSPQEIRNAIYEGTLLSTVRTLNNNTAWRSIFGEKKNSRLKDEELVLRFLAMRARSDKYSRPMRDFLNDFANDLKNVDQAVLEEFSKAFTDAIQVIYDVKGKGAFRPRGTLNAAVFEAVMLGVSSRIEKDSTPVDKEKLRKAYDALLADNEFTAASERATADEEAVKTRRRVATTTFAGC